MILFTSADVDYVDTRTTLTFPAGTGPGTRDCISVQILDDLIVEDVETFSVRIYSIVPSAGVELPTNEDIYSRIDIISPHATLFITDNESENTAHHMFIGSLGLIYNYVKCSFCSWMEYMYIYVR